MKSLFDIILDERLESIRKVLGKKNQEYAKESNRFHNFDEAGRLLQCSPEHALKGMFIKHLVSVFDLIEKFGNKPDGFNTSETDALNLEALVDEKIGDAINYLILLEGMFTRKIWIKMGDPNNPMQFTRRNVKCSNLSVPIPTEVSGE